MTTEAGIATKALATKTREARIAKATLARMSTDTSIARNTTKATEARNATKAREARIPRLTNGPRLA